MDAGPRVRLEFQPPAAPIAVGVWRCRWRVSNIGSAPFSINASWLPHGRFRADRDELNPPIQIGGGGSDRLAFDVQCSEEAGTEVENCFVILTVEETGEEWRVFGRLTVSFGGGGVPTPKTELVTVSQVGFSESTSAVSV